MTFGDIFIFLIYLSLPFIPILACIVIRKRYKYLFGFVVAFVTSALLMSAVVIVGWAGHNWDLKRQIAPLDRNGDGIWTPEEKATWTEQDRENVDRFIGDGGRNVFAVFIFPMLAAVYSLIVVSLYWLVAGVMTWFNERNKTIHA